jgi:hypothetical protein
VTLALVDDPGAVITGVLVILGSLALGAFAVICSRR